MGTGQYVLRVLRLSGSNYAGVGSSPGTVTSPGAQSFSANLPIQAGDLIGIDVPDQQGIALGLVAGSNYYTWAPVLGSTPTPFSFDNSGNAVALRADVQYPDPASPSAPAATPKKCKKKKHKRSASAAKTKCKKKKK